MKLAKLQLLSEACYTELNYCEKTTACAFIYAGRCAVANNNVSEIMRAKEKLYLMITSSRNARCASTFSVVVAVILKVLSSVVTDQNI